MKKQTMVFSLNVVLNVIMLAVVALLLVFTVLLVRTKLLQNAQSMGMALAENYGAGEEQTLLTISRNIELAGKSVDAILDGNGSDEEIQRWLRGYFIQLSNIMGEGAVDPYAIIDGKIVAANPWEGDEDYDYASTQWYQGAIEADGKVAQSGIYQDTITGSLIYTVSVALSTPGDVLAMDVFIGNEVLHNAVLTLPEDYSYYLCDEDGTLLYSYTKWDERTHDVRRYAQKLLEGIEDGSLSAFDATYEDMDGVSRGVYYMQMSNGWTVMVTIPTEVILVGDPNMVVYVLAGVAVLLFASLLALSARDAVRSHRMKKADDTAHMLGDSFYTICRVNFRDGTYEAIKFHPDLRGVLPVKGEYTQIIETMRTLVKPSTFQEFQANFSLDSIRARVEQGVKDYGGDYERRFGDVYRWVNIRTLYDKKLAPDEVILCFREVDAEKRHQMRQTLALQETLEAAQRSGKAKSEFFSSMSHDMRTPLNAIIGCCQLAQKSHKAEDHGQVWDYIKKIEFASNQLLALINDILDLSRMEMGTHVLEEDTFNLRDLLNNVAGLFQEHAEEQGKSFETFIDIQDDVVVGDQKKTLQIFNNLLSNALKYSESGDSIRLEARQFVFQRHSKYQIVVEDTGLGMSDEFQKHLFEPYTRETTFSSQTTVGTGLGMAIVKSVVQQMSGEISVESRLGEGSKFTVTIPFKTPEELGSAEPGLEPATGEGDVPFDWTGLTVLLAEDNELNREIVTEMLQELGAQVLQATNGAEAVDVFRTTRVYSVDLILMDMQMPKLDGCQAASAIRALDREDAAWVPIVAVTANAFAEDIDKTTRAGMNWHVSKPIDFTVLSQTVERIFQRQREQQRMNKSKQEARE